MKNIELRGKRAQLIKDADAIVAAAQAEGRSMTSEEKTKFEAIEADARSFKQEIDIIERNAEMKKELAANEGEARSAAPKATASSAFSKYLRHGMGSLNAQERSLIQQRGTATQATVGGTPEGALGGFLVPQEFSNELDIATLFTGEVERLAKKLNTASGGLLDYPVVDDTDTDAILTTETSAVTTADMQFANKQLSAYNYSSLVKVSAQLLQDSAFDLNSFLVEAMGERIARATNAAFTTGDASSKPQGIVVGSSLGNTAAGASAITADDVLDLIYSIDASYRNKPSFGLMAHDNIISAIRALGVGSSNDYPIWQPGMAVGQPDRIFGVPVYVNNDMQSSIATATKTMIAADFSKYVVRNAGGVQFLRLNERFMNNLEVGFIAYKRADGAVLNSAAVKHLIQA
jgi:HK97 family phage major capsid protein